MRRVYALMTPATPGRREVLVNNLRIETGQRAQLPPDCLIEIGGLYFMFMPNNRRKERPRPASPTREQAAGDAAMEDEPAAEPAAEPAEPAAEPAEPAELAAAGAEEPAAAVTAAAD